jgi:hypothetical protein
VLERELLHEEERRAHVHGEEAVELVGGQLLEPAEAATRMVRDEDVDVAELAPRRGHDPSERVRIGQVGLEVLDARLGAPRLRFVVRRPAVPEDGGAELLEPVRNRVADSRAAAHPGDEGRAAAERRHGRP